MSYGSCLSPGSITNELRIMAITQASPFSWPHRTEPIAIVAGSWGTWSYAEWKLKIRLGSDSLGAPPFKFSPGAVSSIG